MVREHGCETVGTLQEPARSYACEGVGPFRETGFARRLTRLRRATTGQAPAATVQGSDSRPNFGDSPLIAARRNPRLNLRAILARLFLSRCEQKETAVSARGDSL